MQNSRKNRRYTLSRKLRLVNGHTGEVLGHLGNLTTSGLLVFSEGPIGLNGSDTLTLDLLLPSELDGVSSIRLEARNIWTKSMQHLRFHASGFAFTELGERERVLIAKVIDELGEEA
jgi:hypothetical protein